MGFYREGIIIRKIADLIGKTEWWLETRINELTTKSEIKIHEINRRKLAFEKRRKELINKLKGCKTDAEAAEKLGVVLHTVYMSRKRYNIPKLSIFKNN
jgi:hypothetical protein